MSVHNSSTSLNQGLQNPQTHFGNLIPSERASPNDSQLNISTNNNEKNYTRRSSVQTSPINLTQNLQGLSLSSSAIQAGDSQHLPLNSPNHDSQHIQQQQQQQHFTLKIKNLPNDITSREAHSIFTFAKDFAGLELIPDSNNVPTIYAKFKSLSAASTHSQILESTQIFGSSYPYYLKAEIVDTSFTPQLNLGSAPSSNKRPSIGTQRSRFLFSDPFSTEAIAESQELQNANGVGKSLIMMESQQDAREYDQLVRDPWQSTGSSAVPNGSLPPSSAHGVQAQNSQPTSANASFSNSTPQTPGVEWDRRRQGSVFFNNQSPLLSSQLSSSQISTSLSLNNQIPQQPNQQNLGQPNIGLPPLSATSNQQISSLLSSNQNPLPQSAVSTSSGQKIQVPPNSAQSGLSDSQPSSQVDLSLLARIPPPANPADQNLPCNTLYVGNLPPDATEAELRQLFAPQRGFRRLSFKTKTQTSNGGAPVQSGHIHGPMCFVEFEDVAYATRALAELYGRTLPRPGGLPGKGGIRLSFSKNPLGVRGPGQRRTSGFAFNQPVFKN